jgi:hypothetical protein
VYPQEVFDDLRERDAFLMKYPAVDDPSCANCPA